MNPLLDYGTLPRFGDIGSEHVESALDFLLSSNRKQIHNLIDTEIQPSWTGFVEPLMESSAKLQWMWSSVSHLKEVRDQADLRRVYEACLPKLTDYHTELRQNRALYDATVALQGSAGFPDYDQARKKAVELEIKYFRLAGVHLGSRDQERYGQISTRLSELGNSFSQNLMDAMDAWEIRVTDPGRLSGLPDHLLEAGRKRAADRKQDGWLFTLHGTSYTQLLTHSDDRSLREAVYRAHVTRASALGPHDRKQDNAPVICEILRLREELSALLGFGSYAEYALETRMADSPEEVADFLDDLARRSRPVAERELADLQAFARSALGLERLEAWDHAWAGEKYKESRFAYTAEEVRPYFPLEKVLDGLFTLLRKLFGVTVRQEKAEQVWEDSVRFLSVFDGSGQLRGYCYMDLYARSHKSGGAWMSGFQGRMRTGSVDRLPIAFLVCNFHRPLDGQPALLDHDDVVTLFHECGHALHHLLTRVEVLHVAGINGVPWDAVEFPSQLLENWCWNRQALDLISGHCQTGDSIPDALFDKIRAGRNFNSGMDMLRQVELALFDLEIHRTPGAGESIERVREILAAVRSRVAVTVPPTFNRFENGFSHIFSGGYAAGYYSYKWAEVLAADAFGLFEEQGVLDAETGRALLCKILETGGSRDPMETFVDFRGRKPEVDALLQASGLSNALQRY